jgi:serine protease AprX
MIDEGVSPDEIGRARLATRRRLGSALESKATDAFCLSFTRPVLAARLEAFTLESLAVEAAAPEQQRAVIELRDSRPLSPDARGGQEAIKSARDRFYRQLGGLRDDLERATVSVAPRLTGRPRIGIAAASVQACWLNHTIRADTHATVLGDVAADKAVERIDVPRPLRPEGVDVTIIAAAALRQAEHCSGAGLTVGVIDSEVQLGHPALQDRVVHRRNYTQEPFGTPASHGTSVAGIIAASHPAFSGMAPEALIYNYKVLSTHAALHAEDFEAALAIQHALEDGLRIVNCSWGAGPASDGTSREARACNAAWRLGMTIVKSAGNNGPGLGTLTTPADAEGVLVVGASDVAGRQVPEYSSRGPTADGRMRPHLIAPGGDFGAAIDGVLLGGGTGDLGDVGTSFAAPHVAGLLALLLEREPGLTPDQQRDRIISTCQPLPGVEPELQGSGLVSPASLFR